MTTVPVAVLPAECAMADAAFRAVLDTVGGADAWSAATRQAFLAWSAKHRDLMAVAEGKVLTAEREAGTWALRGDRDLAGFVGRTARTGRGAGMAAVGQAGTLAAMPAVAEALVDGPVTPTHVQQITRATAGSPLLAAELASPAGQAQLVALAGRLDGGEFGKALAQLSASLDPASRQRAHDEQRANRSFAWTHTSSGTLIKGRLDSVAGHKLAKAIDALCPRPALDDDRSREARQADALMGLVERAAADRTTTPGAVAPVQAIVTFTQQTWTALRAVRPAQAGTRRGGGPGACGAAAAFTGADETGGGRPPDPVARYGDLRPAADQPVDQDSVPGSALDVIGRLRGLEPVIDETGQAWPASEVARALCDCALTRAVIGTPDAELNLGRESRTFKRQHWLALYAAGITGCSIAGCGMPLAYCQLHHITWWQRDGGPTNLANCAAYCSYHHHEIHRLGIRVSRDPDGTLHHHHPDGRTYGGTPRGGEESDSAAATSWPGGSRTPLEPATVSIEPATGAPSGQPLPAGLSGAPPPPPADPRDDSGERDDPGERDDRGERDVPGDGPPLRARSSRAPSRAPCDGRGDDPPPQDLLDLLSA